ncbi:MAG TPA: hypothetical protein VF546_03455 [Pyrinomonadaceae bacterium]|jgi:hypothetical protein
MKNLKKALAMLTLTLTLTANTFADDGFMHTGAPAPSSQTVEDEPPTDGIIWAEGVDALTQIGLDVLQGLLTRF